MLARRPEPCMGGFKSISLFAAASVNVIEQSEVNIMKHRPHSDPSSGKRKALSCTSLQSVHHQRAFF